jgi:hypothetical protein
VLYNWKCVVYGTAAVEEAGDQEAMDTLLTLGGVNNSRRRVRRAPERLADEEEGP